MLRQAYRAIARSVDTPRTVDGSAPRASESASQGGENSTARKDTRSYSQPRPCTQGLRNLGPHFSHAPGHSFFGGRLGDFGGALHHRREDDRNVNALFHGSSHKSWLRGHRSDSHLCWRAIRGGAAGVEDEGGSGVARGSSTAGGGGREGGRSSRSLLCHGRRLEALLAPPSKLSTMHSRPLP